MNSKDLLRNVLAGRPAARSPFIPLANCFAGRVSQLPLRQMFSDPTKMANSLYRAQRLGQYDGILVYNPVLEATALLQEVEWPDELKFPEVSLAWRDKCQASAVEDIISSKAFTTLTETTKRLVAVTGRQVGIIAGIAGPFSMMYQLKGEKWLKNPGEFTTEVAGWGELLLAEAKVLAEQRVDLVLVIETIQKGIKPEHWEIMRKIFKPAWNVVKYYNGFTGLFIQGEILAEEMREILSIGQDAVFLAWGNSFHILEEKVNRKLMASGICLDNVFFVKPASDLAENFRRLGNLAEEGRFIFSTCGELPGETPVENIKMVMSWLTACK